MGTGEGVGAGEGVAGEGVGVAFAFDVTFFCAKAGIADRPANNSAADTRNFI
jgi:hypothetical protein